MTCLRTARVASTTLLLMTAIACSSGSSSTVQPPPAAASGSPAAPGSPVTAAGATAVPMGAPPAGGNAASGTAGAAPSAPGGSAGTPAPVAMAGSGAMVPPGAAGGAPVEGGPVPTTPTAPGVSEWTMMGYDLGSTYFNRAETKLTKENAAMLAEVYTVDMGGNVYGAPLQVGDKIYTSGGPNVRALDAATGDELWRAMVGTSGSMAYADGTLYLHGAGGRVTALNAEDGNRLWQMPANPQTGDGSSSPLVVGDLVVVGGSNGGIELGGGAFRGFMSALDRKTGAMKWTTYTVPESGPRGASLWSSPSADLEAGRVYGATGNNYGMPASDTSDAFLAFDMTSGEIVWKQQRVMGDTFSLSSPGPDADFGANPVLYETMVDGQLTKMLSAGNKGGVAHAVRREDGELVWERMLCSGSADGGRGIFVNSTWAGKNMLFACNEGGPATLYALDGATGDIAWMRKLEGQVWGRMSVANGVGFVGTGTKLEVFDVDTGNVIKTFSSKGGTVAGTITIANGRVAFGEGMSWTSTTSAGRTLHVLAVP